MRHSSVAGAAGRSADVDQLLRGEHKNPHAYLGPHDIAGPGGRKGVVIRARHPDAAEARCKIEGRAYRMASVTDGIFEARIPDIELPVQYRLQYTFANGHVWETDDPYRFATSLSVVEASALASGTALTPWNLRGAHLREMAGTMGASFVVHAPAARRVSVVGDFCRWDGRRCPMRLVSEESGIWELFVPGIAEGELYKFEIFGADGSMVFKTDPCAQQMEAPPGTAAVVARTSTFIWDDNNWMRRRAAEAGTDRPICIYEVHPGSFISSEGEEGSLPFSQLAPLVIAQVKRLGLSHVLLTPVAEYGADDSIGFQVHGFFAVTSRYGGADQLRAFVNDCHMSGVGVLLRWVATEFSADLSGLARFDGTALYEVSGSSTRNSWDNVEFNFASGTVRQFLLQTAEYWLREFHADGLVLPGIDRKLAGGGESDAAGLAEFLTSLFSMVRRGFPGALVVAEGMDVDRLKTIGTAQDATGFDLVRSFAWGSDVVSYFATPVEERGAVREQLRASLLAAGDSRSIVGLALEDMARPPALLRAMPGDLWQKLSSLRLLLAAVFTCPGRKLLFMGSEIAGTDPWSSTGGISWHLQAELGHADFQEFVVALVSLYSGSPSLWRDGSDGDFVTTVAAERDARVFAWTRRTAGEITVVVLNSGNARIDDYSVVVPMAGRYALLLNSDSTLFGGGGRGTEDDVMSLPLVHAGQAPSIALSLPPLGALVLRYIGDA